MNKNGASQPPLRLWPGWVAASLLFLGRCGIPLLVAGYEGFSLALIATLVGCLVTIVWWLLLSRAPWRHRLGAVSAMVLALSTTWYLNHPSMGMMWAVAYGLPALCLGLIAWAITSQHLAAKPRRLLFGVIFLVASAPWMLLRLQGLTGEHEFQFAWRWSLSPEEQLLEQSLDRPSAPAETSKASAADVSWPGFRGPMRTGAVPGLTIETDWSKSPPAELWRQPIGPGWSSFAVQGDLLYTQEQRGEEELVSCYRTTTGEPVWTHSDPVRFYESMGGAGPRSTPALVSGSLYALGATGILNTLDAADGTLLWRRNIATDSGARVPGWGFAGSPLLVDDLVVVAAGGKLVAYDRSTGEPRWFGPDGGPSYSSPQLMRIDGVPQIVFLSGGKAISVAPHDGELLWQHTWTGQPLVQPAQTVDGDVLISAGEGKGIRRLTIGHTAAQWTAEELWTSHRLKPNFNDFVLHRGHAFGFDGSILASLDLTAGKRRWKGGRYGQGQLLLLPDQDLLLVLSEKGELALVEASTEGFKELARLPALEGKTWNHPALVGNLLLVRNSQEMAAFRLTGSKLNRPTRASRLGRQ